MDLAGVQNVILTAASGMMCFKHMQFEIPTNVSQMRTRGEGKAPVQRSKLGFKCGPVKPFDSSRF